MKRRVSYQWRLREVMAAAGMFAATDLEPYLRERGITLSSVQVCGWSPRLRSGCPCRCWPRSATSSAALPPS